MGLKATTKSMINTAKNGRYAKAHPEVRRHTARLLRDLRKTTNGRRIAKMGYTGRSC